MIFYKKINNVLKNISLHISIVNNFFKVDIFINFNSNIWREIKLKNLCTLYFYLKRKQFMLLKLELLFSFFFFIINVIILHHIYYNYYIYYNLI